MPDRKITLCLLVIFSYAALPQGAAAQEAQPPEPLPPETDPPGVSNEDLGISRRFLSLRYGYLSEANSNHAIGQFVLENYMLLDGSLDWLTGALDSRGEESVGMRTLLGLTWVWGAWRLRPAYSLAYHEFGHGTRMRAAGANPIYFFSDFDYTQSLIDARVQTALVSAGVPTVIAAREVRPTRYTNFFTYLGDAIAGGKSSGYTTFDHPFTSTAPADWDAVITGGGVNNEMYLTELIEDQAYYNGASFVYFFQYINGKQASYDYFRAQDDNQTLRTTGDMATILTYYNRKRDYTNPTVADLLNRPVGSELLATEVLATDFFFTLQPVTPAQMVANTLTSLQNGDHNYHITRADIETGNLIALYGSSTTYLLMYSFMKYMFEGDATVHSWELAGIRLPDISFYHSRRGISYKLRSGYRWHRWTFPFAVEHVTKGDMTTEGTLGVRYDADQYAVTFTSIVGRSGGAGVEFDYYLPVADFANARLGSRIFYHSVNTLEGERNMSRVEPGSYAELEADVYVSLVY